MTEKHLSVDAQVFFDGMVLVNILLNDDAAVDTEDLPGDEGGSGAG